MKCLPFLLVSLAGAALLFAREPAQSPAQGGDAEILDTISDGAPQAPAERPVLPEFVVRSEIVRRVEVVAAPPMAGLPPVTGTISETVRLVEDPKLPDPVTLPDPLPLPAAVEADGPQVGERWEVERGSDADGETEILFLSATVYDRSRTLLRCLPNGNPGGEIAVWSNLDFNFFGGFGSFEVKGTDGGVRRYALIMGIGNEDAEGRAAFRAGQGEPYEPPAIPELPELANEGPAFVILGAAPDAAGVRAIEDLHELYRHEGGRMKAAYLARAEAEKSRRAFLLAHPPVPADVTVSFWQREHPVGMSADTIKKEGGK